MAIEQHIRFSSPKMPTLQELGDFINTCLQACVPRDQPVTVRISGGQMETTYLFEVKL